MIKKPKTKKSLYRRITRPTVQLALAIALLLLSVRLSRGAPMLDWEVQVFRFFYDWPQNLHFFFFVITQFGSIYVLMTLSLLYLGRQHYHIVLRMLLSGLLAYLMSGVAKDLWGRMRPNEFLQDVVVLDYVVRGPGFPSGHTALATALGMTLAYHAHKKHKWIFYGLILLVGISRMYLGLHAPLDIVGGFAIGWISYALFRHIALHDVVFGSRRLQPVRVVVKAAPIQKKNPRKVKK